MFELKNMDKCNVHLQYRYTDHANKSYSKMNKLK